MQKRPLGYLSEPIDQICLMPSIIIVNFLGGSSLACYKCFNAQIKSGSMLLQNLLKRNSNPDCADPSAVEHLNSVFCSDSSEICGLVQAEVSTSVSWSKRPILSLPNFLLLPPMHQKWTVLSGQLFRKGNAQLYLFTSNSTHFSWSSYKAIETDERTDNYQFLVSPGCEQPLRNNY